LFKLATTVDNAFELQGFQCRFGGSRAAVFAGFAMKMGGTSVTIVGRNVSVNGALFTGSSHTVGLTVVGSPAQTIKLDSHDNCVHFETNKQPLPPSLNPGYYHNMNVNIADTIAALDGVCGTPQGRTPVQRRDALFSSSELDSLCQICGMSNCIRRLDGRRLEMSQPVDWAPVANAEEACRLSGISHSDASEKCQALSDDPVYLDACIYDYCASAGEESLVANAVESRKREVARAQIYKTSAALGVTTTESLSSAPTAAPVSMLAILVARAIFLSLVAQ